MDAEFWHRRWRNNQIAFHQGETNALLADHFEDAFGQAGGRVFVPLCGKTRDIAWLMSRGFHVVGAELNAMAVDQLFEELGMVPDRADAGSLKRLGGEGVEIFVGDIFALSRDALGPIDVVYDRAALVALPDGMRTAYAFHLMHITDVAPQFLICFDYDQTEMDGPPFSVPASEVRRCYGERYDLELFKTVDVAGGLKGKCAATENLWLLRSLPSES